VTREELEEGRDYLKAFDSSPSLGEMRAIHFWLMDHADALLSLAEEARWRSVTEEPPPQLLEVDAIFSRGDECSRSVRASLDSDGHWYDSIGGLRIAPTHWRPLPKGPVKP
jgi:hypothetical protein